MGRITWITQNGYADKQGVTQEGYWEIATSWQGLQEEQYNSFMAIFFDDFVNGQELRVGFVRKARGSGGGVYYITLDEYNPKAFKFTISVSLDYLNPDATYVRLRNHITEISNGARWYISTSTKVESSILSIFSSPKVVSLDSMFHGHIHFAKS